MGCEDDGRAFITQLAHQPPHISPELDIHTGSRLVEEQQLGLVAQRLGNHHAPLHAAGQLGDLAVALVPERKCTQDLLDQRIVARLAEEATAQIHGIDHPLEHVGGEFLRHQADDRTCMPVALDDIMPIDGHRSAARRNEPADDGDQRRLARAIGAKQRENLALLDLEIDRAECLMPTGISFGNAPQGKNGSHAAELSDRREIA